MSASLQSSDSRTLPPPSERYTILGWLRKNLFGSWFDAILTVVASSFIIWALYTFLNWATGTAEWDAVVNNIPLYMKGQYPLDQVWRIWLSVYLLGFTVGLMWGVYVRGREMVGIVLFSIPILLGIIGLAFGSPVWLNLLLIDVFAVVAYLLGRRFPKRLQRPAITLLLLYMPLVLLLVRGLGVGGFLPVVPSNLWGGLLLSLLLSVVGIVFSFPIGVLLALGRQSNLRAIKLLCVIYIEFIRGVPLITLLFMGQVMLNFFLPRGYTVDLVIRAMVAIIVFAAAYLAENVRGGLQAIPNGQYEAADAVGLNGLQKMIHIILPQALRVVIPVIVGQFIGLFKDTSLVALVGLLDLLGIARAVLANPNYIGKQIEVYTFVALVYWVFSYSMSYGSRRLEGSLGVGER